MDRAAYLAQLQALLPPGDAWPRDPGSTLTRLLDAFAGELAGIGARAADLITEADPRVTDELLADWERVCGLPDDCTGPVDRLEARRAQVVQRLTSRGGQSPAFFIALASALGYEITITEFHSFIVGSACDASLDTDPWRYTWRVNAAAVTITEMGCDSGCTEALRAWGNEPLECAIRRRKPAHTHVLFSYGG